MNIRKIIVTKEIVFAEGNRVAPKPVTHAVALAVIDGGRLFPRVGKGPITT